MKLDNLTDLFFVAAVFVPGFIFRSVLASFMPMREHRAKEFLILGLLTATAFNYAVCSPVIYLLLQGWLFPHSLTAQAFAWLAIIFVVPIALAVLWAEILQNDALGWLYQILRLRSINPVPTGWDWIFGRADPCYLLVTLTDGTKIAGYFGPQSMASSDPDRPDLYLEKVYTIPQSGAWQEVTASRGMYIKGAQIAFIEFKG